MAISRLAKKEDIRNLGFGYYVKSPVIFHLEHDGVMNKINNLLSLYSFPPKRMVFSSISLNFCINQIISSTTYVVEVEKEYIQTPVDDDGIPVTGTFLQKMIKKLENHD